MNIKKLIVIFITFIYLPSLFAQGQQGALSQVPGYGESQVLGEQERGVYFELRGGNSGLVPLDHRDLFPPQSGMPNRLSHGQLAPGMVPQHEEKYEPPSQQF